MTYTPCLQLGCRIPGRINIITVLLLLGSMFASESPVHDHSINDSSNITLFSNLTGLSRASAQGQWDCSRLLENFVYCQALSTSQWKKHQGAAFVERSAKPAKKIIPCSTFELHLLIWIGQDNRFNTTFIAYKDRQTPGLIPVKRVSKRCSFRG